MVVREKNMSLYETNKFLKEIVIMTFTKVTKIPKRKSRYSHEDFMGYFTEFIKSGIKMAKVNYDAYEYSNVHSAYNCLHRGARHWDFPIKVCKRGNDIYFIRIDE